MTKLGTVMIAVALVAGGTSLALAQNGQPTGNESPVAGGANGNNGMPPATYKGPGAMKTYKSSEFQGRSTLYDQAPANANGNNGMPPASYKGPGAMKTYKASAE